MVPLSDVPLARESLAALGDQDFSAADFFESYGAKIEEAGERPELPFLPEIRRELLDLIAYFEAEHDPDYRAWPQAGLRAFAMLAPIHVAEGVLWIKADLLERAIRSARPNEGWAWWHALGRAILDDAPDIAGRFDLTERAVRKYKTFLVGFERGAA
jgi:hypothetical protein